MYTFLLRSHNKLLIELEWEKNFNYISMYALLLEKLQIEMKYFCESFYIIYNYIYKVALKEFINVFLLFHNKHMYMYLYVHSSTHAILSSMLYF